MRDVAEAAEIVRLEADNARLQNEVAAAKAALIAKQEAAGKTHYLLPGQAAATPATAKVAAPAPAATASGGEGEKTPRKEKKGKKEGKKEGAAAATGPDKATAVGALPLDVTRLDFRVGKIVKCEMHPDAEALYLETSEAPLLPHAVSVSCCPCGSCDIVMLAPTFLDIPCSYNTLVLRPPTPLAEAH